MGERLRIGSLFSGYGGLELGIQAVIDAETVWHVEYDKAPSKILAHHWPTVPNHGDITAVDWATVEPVDVLCGGFPCQDVSTAGLRRGLKPGTRSGLWSHFALAIDQLRPGLVIIENVRGLLSAEAHSDLEPDPWDLGGPSRGHGPALRALGAVLGDLADLGYDAEWCGIRAADAGAPHGRFRVFVLAHPADPGGVEHGRAGARRPGGMAAVESRPDSEGVRDRSGVAADSDTSRAAGVAAPDTHGQRHGRREDGRSVGHLDSHDASEARERERTRGITGDRSSAPAPDTAHGHGHGHGARGARDGGSEPANSGGFAPDALWTALGGTPLTRNPEDGVTDGKAHVGAPPTVGTAEPGEPDRGTRRLQPETAEEPTWGVYEPAVRRWEAVTGRRAPAPTTTSAAGAPQLAARFVEWMMGLPDGHVTDVGLTRNEQLKALGNGVVPQQAALALSGLLARAEVAA